MADARQVVSDRYDMAAAAVDRVAEARDAAAVEQLFEPLNVLTKMVAQELYREAERYLDDEHDLPAEWRAAWVDEFTVVTQTEPGSDEFDAAVRQLAHTLAVRRTRDLTEILPRLADAGVDLEELGDRMLMYDR